MTNQTEPQAAERLHERISALENLIASTKEKIEAFPENKILRFLIQQDEGRLHRLKQELKQVEADARENRSGFTRSGDLKMTG